MKKALLITAALALILGASALAAADSDWLGTFDGDLAGAWNGTVHDNPDEDQVPHFSGEWSIEETGEHGTLFGVYESPQPGYYKVSSGIIYDDAANNIGSWEGYFDLNYDGVPGSIAQGTWWLIDATVGGKWYGQAMRP